MKQGGRLFDPTRQPAYQLIAVLDDPTEPLAKDRSTVMAASDKLYAVTNVVTWDMVREATASKATLTLLLEHLQDGFSGQTHALPPELRPFQR
ncbi:hypothetical protein PoB_003900700 [Plakobranchus ocellatus]|uniref:Uncharacterized protein n=1 Tax=Plakobranchus ocellatus TaxID=259542 RepID=A0AAV4AYZ3_9GAST|nr:hypothetical protein PoB_003900700 [Plakobranchus ocellatus]